MNESEPATRAGRRERKKRLKMKVSGARVKQLRKLISEKSKKTKP